MAEALSKLQKNCISALRLSEASAEALIEEINLHIGIARADMVRSGVAVEVAEDEDNMLSSNVIVKYVTSQMASAESERDKAMAYYKICLDELRRSL